MNIEYEKKTELALHDLMTANKRHGLAGRISIGPKAALLAALLACAGLANEAYGGVVIVGVPPVVVVPEPIITVAPPEPIVTVGVPWPGFGVFGGDYDRRRDAHDYGRRGAESRGDARRGGDGRRR